MLRRTRRRNRQYTFLRGHHGADGSIRVNEQLEVLDPQLNPISGVYAIGDNAMPESGRLPATAQGECCGHTTAIRESDPTVATQMATYITKTLNTTAAGASIESRPAFKWKNKGSMVLIGDKTVCRFPAFHTLLTHRAW